MADLQIDDILNDFHQESSRTKKSQQQSSNIDSQLLTAMLNERMAPELLPYKRDLMNKVLEVLSYQQQNLLDSHEYGDSNAGTGVVDPGSKLQLMIIETDIERLTYIIRLYLRIRLQKLDEFLIHYINETSEEGEDEKESILSKEEKEYMHKHFKILTKLYNNSFLKKLPHFLTLLDDNVGNQSMVSKPNLDLPVFIRVKSTEPILVSLGDEELELVHGGIYVVKYKWIQKYVEIDDVELI